MTDEMKKTLKPICLFNGDLTLNEIALFRDCEETLISIAPSPETKLQASIFLHTYVFPVIDLIKAAQNVHPAFHANNPDTASTIVEKILANAGLVAHRPLSVPSPLEATTSAPTLESATAALNASIATRTATATSGKNHIAPGPNVKTIMLLPKPAMQNTQSTQPIDLCTEIGQIVDAAFTHAYHCRNVDGHMHVNLRFRSLARYGIDCIRSNLVHTIGRNNSVKIFIDMTGCDLTINSVHKMINEFQWKNISYVQLDDNKITVDELLCDFGDTQQKEIITSHFLFIKKTDVFLLSAWTSEFVQQIMKTHQLYYNSN